MDVRLVKLVTGELILGKFDAEAKKIKDVATLQMVPAESGGAQMMMIPYGYPFEQEFCGSIDEVHFLYVYKDLPDDLETRYLEIVSNLTLRASSLTGPKAGKVSLIKP